MNKLRISDHTFGKILSLPPFFFLFLLICYPLYHLIYCSLHQINPVRPFKFVWFENYVFLFNQPLFHRIVLNTIIYAALVTSLTMSIALIVALCLNNIKKLSSIFRTIVILPWATPLVLSGFVIAWIFNPTYGIFNYILQSLGFQPINIYSSADLMIFVAALADTWTRIPLACLIILAELQNIPIHLYESAKIDGASSFAIFRHIVLPLIFHSILFSSFLTFLFSFRTPDVFLSLAPGGGPGRSGMVLGQYLYEEFLYGNIGLSSTIGVVILISCCILGTGYIVAYETYYQKLVGRGS